MKCGTYERWALREAGREIGPFRKRLLTRHALRCPACSDFRASLPRWMNTARSALDIGAAGKEAASNVVQLAPALGRRMPREKRFAFPAVCSPSVLRPAALAAGLAVLFTSGLFIFSHSRIPPDHPAGVATHSPLPFSDMELWDLETDLMAENLAAIAFDLRYAHPVEPPELRDEIDALALELLRMEESA